MRAGTVAVVAVAALALLLASRRASAAVPGAIYLDPFDPLAFLPDDPLQWWPVNTNDDPVYDPRDVNSRRFHPSQMVPSEELATWLRSKERFVATRYELGDGGYTIGYGWFEPYSRAHLMPLTISEPDARAKFYEHLEDRGARWVRNYVNVNLQQNEFDALTSMAFNLSPRSFKRIADALNAGDDWRAVALQFTRPGTNLERGLRNRRNAEFAMFDAGVYA